MNDIVTLLKKAMQSERDGYHHYNRAAEMTKDQKAKEVFRGLANDELLHHRALEDILTEYQTRGSLPEIQPLSLPGNLPSKDFSPIFSENFKERLTDAHGEISAISIGMVLEQNAINFYGDLSQRAENSSLKTFFSNLADWEKIHLEALSLQMEFVRDEYWARSQFHPF